MEANQYHETSHKNKAGHQTYRIGIANIGKGAKVTCPVDPVLES